MILINGAFFLLLRKQGQKQSTRAHNRNVNGKQFQKRGRNGERLKRLSPDYGDISLSPLSFDTKQRGEETSEHYRAEKSKVSPFLGGERELTRSRSFVGRSSICPSHDYHPNS